MTTIEKVLQWAADKDLLKKENSLAQLGKVEEEVEEVRRCIEHELPFDDLELELGDVFVTIIILAAQNDLDITTCLDKAYAKIAKRTGKTINGTFVKDAY